MSDTESLVAIEYSNSKFEKVEILIFTWRIRQNSVCVYPELNFDADYKVNGTDVYAGSYIDRYGMDVKLQGNYRMERLTLKKC